MKTPRFEELARSWSGDAAFFIVYSREAHPNAKSHAELCAVADALAAMDGDGDNAVTLAEYKGPREMFDPFDLDHDEVVRSHELLAARRIDQFADFAAPSTMNERVAAARRFRDEVPGAIPVLVDPIGEPTARAYGGWPNSAFVIDRQCKVAAAFEWASAREVDAALATVTHRPARAPAEPPALDLAVLADPLRAAKASGKPVLVHFIAAGCKACETMRATLDDPDVATALARYEHATLGVEHDAPWALFEALDLATTPAFVVIAPDGTIRRRTQGLQSREELLAFLQR